MGKLQDKTSVENKRLVEESIGWAASPEEALSDQVGEAVWEILETAKINARKRKIIWADGQKLSINQSIRRIHADYQGVPLELIEANVLEWLEQAVFSQFSSEEQLDQLDRLTQKWIEAHDRREEAEEDRTRTRHS